MPELVDVGQKDLLLPPGIHQATLADVQARFVDTPTKYRRRVEVWWLYQQFRTMVAGFVPLQHEYIDGSFVTSRPAPKDIDVSFWVNADDVDALSPQQSAAFSQLWADRMTRYACDAYLVTPCSEGHPAHAGYLYWKERTEKAWPAYKNRGKMIVPEVTKGYVEVVT